MFYFFIHLYKIIYIFLFNFFIIFSIILYMIQNGLAQYEILRSGVTVVICLLCICSASFSIFSSYNKHYILTTGTVTNNYSSNNIFTSQTLNYTVDNQKYTFDIPLTTNNKSKTSRATYQTGNVSVYYSKNNPQIYHVGNNPMILSEIWLCVACILTVFSILWFIFIRKNKDLAAATGGIAALGSFDYF